MTSMSREIILRFSERTTIKWQYHEIAFGPEATAN